MDAEGGRRTGAARGRRDVAAQGALPPLSLVHYLNSNFSKFFNRTQPSFEQES
jgi:hypothetical protein